MGSYDHIMPEGVFDLATGDHEMMQTEVDTNEVMSSEDPEQDGLVLTNCNSIHRTADWSEVTAGLKTTSDHNIQNLNDSRQNNPQSHISSVAKRHMKPRSVSESECENLSRSILPHSSRKDEANDFKMPVDNASMQPLNEDFDGLPFPNEVKLPVPPDGGWGWVIVAVSFVCCAVVDGLCSVFGILLPDLVIYFQETSSKVSLAGSVLAGGFLLSGPVASVIINCFGCRFATILGSILSAIALIASTWSSSVVVFILVFGGLGGLGLGLIYLPASVMVGFYFDRRRGLAAGISSAGAGVGMLILSLLAAFLAEQYSWKGCLFIMAGICLQCILCGALMRPLVPTLNVLQPNAFLGKDSDEGGIAKSEQVNSKFISSLPVIKENILLNCDDMTTTDVVPSASYASENTNDSKLSSHSKLLLAKNNCPVENQQNTVSRRVIGVSSCVELASEESFPAMKSSKRRVSEDNAQLMSSDYQLVQELSSASDKTCVGNLGIQVRRSNSVLTDPFVMPLMKKDIFYSGSMSSLHSSRTRMDKDAGVASIPELYHPTVYVRKSAMSRAVHILKEMLDVSIMVNLSFVVICAANVFIQLGYFVPIVFLPAYGLSLGLSSQQAATLLAVLGLSNMFGRAIAGALASLPCVNGLHLNNLSVIGAGISTGFLVVCTSFELLLAYAVVFGLCVAGFVPMTTIFLVKFVGLDKLTNSFGLLSMIKGVSTMAGPPIAGALLDSTKSYNSTFYFAGAMFICAGLLFYILPLTQKPVSLAHDCALYYHKDHEEIEQSSEDHTEKAEAV